MKDYDILKEMREEKAAADAYDTSSLEAEMDEKLSTARTMAVNILTNYKGERHKEHYDYGSSLLCSSFDNIAFCIDGIARFKEKARSHGFIHIGNLECTARNILEDLDDAIKHLSSF